MGVYGLLGRVLGHSYSPAIHQLFGSVPYTLFEKEPEEVASFLASKEWTGLNVTVPYKKTVVPFCDALSPLAAGLGSVNTLVRRKDGTIFGDNTDAFGFTQMLHRLGVNCAGKKVLVLGSGGSSVTVQAVLKELGAQVVVISRTGDDNYTNLERHGDASVIVNTTPVGMYPKNGSAPLSLKQFPHIEGVLDLIYNPSRTALIMEAEALGIPHESGLFMLVSQAARSSQLFTGQEISREMTEMVWRSISCRMKNIILIGMPGCGKTTVGHALSEALGRPFADSDEVICSKAGMDISTIFSTEGETGFRKREHAVLRQLGAGSNLVIATGGGCVTLEQNYPVLHQNGTIFWLTRPASLLETAGRPLSLSKGTEQLYRERKPMYEGFADHIIENTDSVQDTVHRILEVLHR